MKLNQPQDIEEVERVFNAYEEALLANDVPKLEAFFWSSPFATRFGVGEQLYGYEAIVAFRRNRKLNFSYRKPVKVTINTFDCGNASVMYEYIADIDGVERRGRQSQTWVRFEGEWKIVSAHISYLGSGESTDAALTFLGLYPETAWLTRIRSNFETTTRMAGQLMDFPISEEIEPESVFEP